MKNKELIVDKSVNKKCLERVQGLLSQFTISEVRNCLNHLNSNTEWLTDHIAVHNPKKEANFWDDLLGPQGRPLL